MNDLKKSLRSYGRKKLDGRTRLHTKETVDNLFQNFNFKIPRVNLISWTSEDIAQYKVDKNLGKFYDGYSKPVLENENEPPLKKPKVEENGKNIFKLVLSRKGETDTFKSQFKTINDGKENSKNSVEKKMDNKNNAGNEMKKNKNDFQINEKKDDENIDQENEIKNNENIDPDNEKKNDENINQNNVMLFNTESFSTSIDFLESMFDGPIETNEKSASTSKIGKIRCRDINELMDISKVEKYCESFNLSQKFLKPVRESVIKLVSSESSTAQNLKKKKLTISTIEILYHKYFNKCVQDTIFISANILNIILMSKEHHKKVLNELKTTEERNDANKMYLKYRTILDSQLKKYLQDIISRFVYSEFELLLQMFFLSIISNTRALERQRFEKIDMYKNIILYLRIIIKDSKLDTKVQTLAEKMLMTKTFIRDCLNLISLIKNSQDIDPSISHRLSIFFLPPIHRKKYFQTVKDAVNSGSNEDFELLIDKAAFKCYKNSKSKGPLEPPSVSITKDNITMKTPVTSKQSTSKSEYSFQSFNVLAEIPSENNESKPTLTLFDGESKEYTPNIIDDPPKESIQSNNVIVDFSNPVLNDTTAETAMPKFKLPEGTALTLQPSVSDGFLKNEPTFVAFKPSIKIKKLIPSNLLKSENDTIFIENKHDEVESQENQSRKVTAKNSIEMASKKSKKKLDVLVKCFRKNCPNDAQVVCSICRLVKYCCKKCQIQDWYQGGHNNNCKLQSTTNLRS